MIERPIVLRDSQAAARALRAGLHPREAPRRALSGHVRLASSDPLRSPPRLKASVGISLPLRSELSRCSTKGCVFPASPHGAGKCWHHELEELEPAHFLSRQPTQFVLDQAKFGLPDQECDASGARDRRRLAALREQFLEDVA
jgi:hypothetical protein